LNRSKTSGLKESIKKKTEEFRQPIIDTLCDLVSIPTVNPPGQSYKECVDYLSVKLKEWRIDHDLVPVPNGKYPRFLIIGSHGEGKGGIHFHGHYDVVPAGSPDQFQPRLEGDCLYGRGSSDMKSGLVAMLFALRAIKESELKLKGKVTFSIVPDEETGGLLGTQYLFNSGLCPKVSWGMLMPEPTGGVVWNANKGALTFRVQIQGKPAHVALEHQGDNAFEHLVQVVQSLLKLKKEIKERKTTMKVHPPEAVRSVMLIGGESGSGVNFNVVPQKAFFTIDRRINPEESLEEAKKELMDVLSKQKKAGIAIEIEVLQEGESSVASAESRLASVLRKSISDIKGKSPAFELCPGLCEIRFFNNRQIPAYAFGPGLLEVSHGPEEYVPISDVLDCTVIYILTALRTLC